MLLVMLIVDDGARAGTAGNVVSSQLRVVKIYDPSIILSKSNKEENAMVW